MSQSTSIIRTTTSPAALSRRDFLRVGATSTAALFTAGVPLRYLNGAFTQAADTNLTGRIAVLMPQQGPGITAYDAFTKVFATHYPNVELLSASVRPYWSDVVEASRKLIDEQQVRVIVTLMNPSLSPFAHDFFTTTDALLIVASAGENIVRHDEHLPNVFHTSLRLWESNHALGQWSAETYGKRGVIVTSLYDSGFDALHAFEMGLEAAGGSVVSTYTQRPNTPIAEQIAALRQMLSDSTPDFIFQMNSASPELVAALPSIAAEFGVPLVNSPLDALAADYNRLGEDSARLAAASLMTANAHAGNLLAARETLRSLHAIHPVHQTLTSAVTNPLSDVACDCAIDTMSAASFKTGWSTPYLIM